MFKEMAEKLKLPRMSMVEQIYEVPPPVDVRAEVEREWALVKDTVNLPDDAVERSGVGSNHRRPRHAFSQIGDSKTPCRSLEITLRHVNHQHLGPGRRHDVQLRAGFYEEKVSRLVCVPVEPAGPRHVQDDPHRHHVVADRSHHLHVAAPMLPGQREAS